MSLYLPDGCTQDQIDRLIEGPEPETEDPDKEPAPEDYSGDAWIPNPDAVPIPIDDDEAPF